MIKEFSRQPRFLAEIPSGKIEVPNPPNAYSKPEISWFTLLAPPGVMLIITILIAMTYQSMFMMLSIATTIMTLIVSLSNATKQIRSYKKKVKEREEKYLQFIADTRNELNIAKQQQIQSMKEMNPEPVECINRMIQVHNKLWERTPAYNDFLALRIGVGSVPLNMEIAYTKQAIIMENDPLLMEPQRLALEFQKINNVPILVNLIESEICGVAGEKEKTVDIIKLMLIQLITHHGYDDVKIVVLSSEEELQQWNWLKFLPHIWSEDFSTRYLLCGKAIAHQTLANLENILKQREKNNMERMALPHYVFIIEDPSLLENEQISKYLYNGQSNLGVSSIFMAPNAAYLPMNCRSIISFQGKGVEIADRVTGEKNIFTIDTIEDTNLDVASRTLASLRIKNTSSNFTLPKSITLFEMIKSKKISDCNVINKWHNNKTYKGLSVPIGAKAGGSLFHLDMHETGCGPHGLVAGTTGSGKSELLQTIIISLAINYHPHDVVFVLIDYKGGGMADVFKGMPHLVGTITNLGGNQTTRALLSIKSELLRRQRIFSEYEVNNIDKYQKLYHNNKDGKKMPAIPHLIMIADEFAELKQDQPEFMKELVSTARVGRSLGVHLILATQKPAGVVDEQIWSNSKFKICLKVQDETDSKDVIKRPDAAMIKEPGRAYIQVGNDEIFELFQSAYSGADYDPDGDKKKDQKTTKRIYKIGLNGKSEQIYPLEEEKNITNEQPTQLKTMVDHIKLSAENNKIEALDGPWLPPLKDIIYFDTLFEKPGKKDKNKSILSIPIGILDDPRQQRQEPLEIDFSKECNLFIYGSPGTGKTYLLKTICLSLAHVYTPLEVNIYIMDFGGTSLKIFEKLPHCGGVMTLEQESKINQFMLFIFRMIEERKELFEQAGCDSFISYRASGNNLPSLIILIDNYFALSETYEEIDEQMVVLSREGVKYGIFLVATASNASLIRYKLTVNFKMAIAYQLVEKGEYDGVVGRREGLEPTNLPGRGLIRSKPPLEFQTMLPEYKEYSTEEIIEWISNEEKNKATPIPIMPSKVDIFKINEKQDHLAIGLNNTDLQPATLDLYLHPVIMVAGEPMSGKSTILNSWIKIMKESEVYIIDSVGMGLLDSMRLTNVKDVLEMKENFIEEIQDILDTRRKQLIDIRKENGNINHLIRSWKQIIILIDKLSELTNSDNYPLKEFLEKIVKEEHGMKVAIIASDNTSELVNNWDSLAKTIRNQQTGILIGNIKDQDLYTLRVPYTFKEKEMEIGDGYFINKNRYTGIRFARLYH
ncbi:S-DNA-T family DNA segregation ATPase FtsK/SpoIIIE [Natranaerovirga hydrolytica]|uniref:S-DNA-T family DNA segregation ATPase FtsK/SpoIIIE n=1 Tax=Natranaerovirga hydrolytica TaxID=680378 RepID=A0A4R1MFX5_9FIRM|nr:type VII secretion protein EssC [Natranaerovirga hydrolytica]TCK90650.1 S-DNA-T family DNA segregation ATPase FtsK/SpoIIIE [Natranaerovirga hydrolytica]